MEQFHGPEIRSVSPEEATVAPSTPAPSIKHSTGGCGLRRVPVNFAFPRGTIATLWQYWCVGNPPLRDLHKSDMSKRDQRRRLTEVKRLMGRVESLLTPAEIVAARSSVASAATQFAAVSSQLQLRSSAATGRTRQLQQLSWRTFARELHEI